MRVAWDADLWSFGSLILRASMRRNVWQVYNRKTGRPNQRPHCLMQHGSAGRPETRPVFTPLCWRAGHRVSGASAQPNTLGAEAPYRGDVCPVVRGGR